nr:MAG TPA: hypothetical protein [Bacteriophage sp.]
MFPSSSVSSKCSPSSNLRIRTILSFLNAGISYISSTVLSKLTSILLFNTYLVTFLIKFNWI